MEDIYETDRRQELLKADLGDLQKRHHLSDAQMLQALHEYETLLIRHVVRDLSTPYG